MFLSVLQLWGRACLVSGLLRNIYLRRIPGILAIGVTSIMVGGGLLMFDLWGVPSVDRSLNLARMRLHELIHRSFHRH